MLRVSLISVSIMLGILSVAQTATAHFPWLALDDQGHAILFFSESPLQRDYHLPASVVDAQVELLPEESTDYQKLDLPVLEKEGFAGRRGEQPVAAGSILRSSFQYGVYHGTLLKYYAYHLPPVGSPAAAKALPKPLDLYATVERTKTGMQLTVYWQGKPLPDASATIIDAEGQQMEEKTDRAGRASFSTGAAGLTGFVIGHTVKDVKGELDDQTYTSESHYCTVSTNFQKHEMNESATSSIPPLPEALASFGAAVCDGSLYVYSGHTGKAHAHSSENLSQSFWRLQLDNPTEWVSLPMQTPLQGLPLVAHGGKLYRVGGLSCRNTADEEADMHSVDEFSCYDPQTKKWSALPALPERRSSHDAVVIGDQLYVVGGWTLAGDSGGDWLDTAYQFDLSKPESQWQPLPSLPFHRRALAVAQWQDKLVAIGGMDEDRNISTAVDCFDPVAGTWSNLAEFPGEDMSGFGVSAWHVNRSLYACGSEGIVYRLSEDGQQWIEVAKLSRPRFFHRLLANSNDELLVIAGAPLDQEAHVPDVEVIKLD